MENAIKQKIQAAVQEQVEKVSQQRLANITGVSTGTLSFIRNNQWEKVSDEMWLKIGNSLHVIGKYNWTIAETNPRKRLMFTLRSAQEDSLVMAVTGSAGIGKSAAISEYANQSRNVFVLVCTEHWTRKAFLKELLRTMGLTSSDDSTTEMMNDVIVALKRMESPLIVMDEADKLTDQVFHFFITLYNRLEDQCGIVLCATGYLEKRIKKGVRTQKKGYEEIFSRIGRKFVKLQNLSRKDIRRVCEANGIFDDEVIERITEESEYDMRRVKRSVWSEAKKESRKYKDESLTMEDYGGDYEGSIDEQP